MPSNSTVETQLLDRAYKQLIDNRVFPPDVTGDEVSGSGGLSTALAIAYAVAL